MADVQMQVLSGIYVSDMIDFRTFLPLNFMPIIMETGISTGYLRPAEGILELGSGPGVDRGGIEWNGSCYRVMGSKLVTISGGGALTILGDVGIGTSQATLTYSFDLLAIAVNGDLFYWDGASLNQVTDPDLGQVLDVVWVDGYFMTTDGQSLVVTELSDPYAVDPLKYGSSEADPDPIVGLIKVKNEVYALNRYTIEIFDNVGGDGFPFQRIEGAQIQRGTLGTNCNTRFLDGVAFLGSGHDSEEISIWYGLNSTSVNISILEVDRILSGYSQLDLSLSVMEERRVDAQQLIYLHLPDQTLVYSHTASEMLSRKIWFRLSSSIIGDSVYRARNFVFCYNKWIVGDPSTPKYGEMSRDFGEAFGNEVGWEIRTPFMFNDTKGGVVNWLELECLTGSTALGEDPTIFTSYSYDGELFSQEKALSVGTRGDRVKRLRWWKQGWFRNFRLQRFRGTSSARISIGRLQADIGGLSG